MKSSSLIFVGLVLVAIPAEAHFKVETPVEWITTDDLGDPQKTGPCGSTAGTPSNQTTRVRAGSTLHIKLSETIPHGGHYRVAVAADRAQFVDPQTVITDNNCVSAAIQPTPVAPVLADGLFPHEQAGATAGKIWETDVTLPATPCANCTLQIIEFMTPHAPNCFYYHCANLEIVAADAPGIDDGGVVIGAPDGGATPASTSAVPTGSTIAGGMPSLRAGEGEACGIGWSASSNVAAAALVPLGLVGLSIARRRRRS